MAKSPYHANIDRATIKRNRRFLNSMSRYADMRDTDEGIMHAMEDYERVKGFAGAFTRPYRPKK